MTNLDNKNLNISESMIIFLIGTVLFVDILDFMLVMPLGPDFAKAFSINQANLGWTVTAYTVAAATSGLVCCAFLDKFDRKKALIVSLTGLTIATFSASFARNFESILISRFLAGMFGGPTSALAYTIITDLIVPSRRGKAMGKVMGAFSCAAVFGVPFSLEISRLFGWQAPFITTSFIGLIITIMIAIKLPSINFHLKDTNNIQKISFINLLSKQNNILGFVFSGMNLMAAFMIIPYVSAFLQNNIELDRKYISLIYLFGGTCSFFGMRIIGKFIDKKSSYLSSILGTSVISITLIIGFIFNGFHVTNLALIIIIFTPFMIGLSIRNVSNSTLNSKIPSSYERASFMALLSSFQHIGSAVGAYASTKILIQGTNGKLVNADKVAILALIIFLLTIPVMYMVENNLKKNS